MTELINEIVRATRSAYEKLRNEHPGDYYYFVLTTTWDGTAPSVSAWSKEALELSVQDSNDPEDAKWGLKWSYADSPYFCFGEEYFNPVRELFGRRPDIHTLIGKARERELKIRVDSMVEALRLLDREGTFGTGDERIRIFINVELNPPDSSNARRAELLNPYDARKEWMAEMAEPV